MNKKKKDLSLLILLCVTAVIGLINMIFNGNKELIVSYLICMSVIPVMYFNYSLCKFENRWENYWKEKNPGSGEPTELRLMIAKIGEWIIIILGFAVALIPNFS